LEQPIACTLGVDCYVQQYVDHDPGPDARDFRCGTLSYDGHEGTDFGILSLADMVRGVPVLAAAAGEVATVRDGMPDILMGADGAPEIAGRECGNGVVLRHADGWETQYCHLRAGSLLVAPGDRVAAGQTLGLVGLSGMTEFPHLHLTLRRNGEVVDPFAPEGSAVCAAAGGQTLWAGPPAYVPGGILRLGFAAEVPDYDAVKAGAAIAPPGPDTGLVLWGYLFGGQAGDAVRIAIDGPGGAVIRHDGQLDGKQGLFFRAAGRLAPDGGWPAGRYAGTLFLVRGGVVIDAGRIVIDMPG
jgi:hypothetical protein